MAEVGWQSGLPGINPHTQAESAKVQQGQFAGNSITAESGPSSALQDSAEELTFIFDNSKKTKLADRKQRRSAEDLEQRLEKLLRVLKPQDDQQDLTSDLKKRFELKQLYKRQLIEAALKGNEGSGERAYAYVRYLKEELTDPKWQQICD